MQACFSLKIVAALALIGLLVGQAAAQSNQVASGVGSNIVNATSISKFSPRTRADILNAIVAGWAQADAAGIKTPLRIQHFFSEIATETDGLTTLSEDMYYTAAELLRTWPHKFSSASQAQQLAAEGQVAIADYVSLSTTGCVTISSGPDRIFDTNAELPSLMAYADVPGNQADKQSRNTFVAARMYAIDIEYSAYFERLVKERQLGTSALDATLLGLTAATTIVHGEAVKTTVAAISTAVAGAKTDIDQDIYMAQTLQILMNTMEAQRLAIRNRIDANMKLAASDYTAWRALTDLDDYYRAGTMAGALNYLASTTGSNAQAQKNLQNGTTPSATATGPTLPAAPTQGMTSLKAPVQALPRQ